MYPINRTTKHTGAAVLILACCLGGPSRGLAQYAQNPSPYNPVYVPRAPVPDSRPPLAPPAVSAPQPAVSNATQPAPASPALPPATMTLSPTASPATSDGLPVIEIAAPSPEKVKGDGELIDN